MAQMYNLNMRRTNSSGIACNSIRTVVVWGRVPDGFLDTLVEALLEERHTGDLAAGGWSQCDIIRSVMERLVPGHWDFVLQGGAAEF